MKGQNQDDKSKTDFSYFYLKNIKIVWQNLQNMNEKQAEKCINLRTLVLGTNLLNFLRKSSTHVQICQE